MIKRLISNKRFSLKSCQRDKLGFSLVELIVVIVIMGVLVMLATPKFLGYVERAELKRIQHDIKIMEGKMEEGMVHNTKEFLSWDDNIKDLRLLVVAKQLFDTEGVARKVDKLSSTRFGRTASSNGSPGLIKNTAKDYKVIPASMKRHIKSSLPGTFYTNVDGKVYYEHDKPLLGAKEEIAQRCEAPKPLDYTFDHLTGTIVKYHGNLQHLIIPAAFEVDGVCWPVRIIGKGAFQIGNYTGPEEEEPIKSVIIPPSVEIIEEDAFKDNKLENVVMPPSVTNIGDNAFAGNNLGSFGNNGDSGGGNSGGAGVGSNNSGVVIQSAGGGGSEGTGGLSIDISSSAFSDNGPSGSSTITPQYRPATNKDLKVSIDVTTNEKGDKVGTITDYDGTDTSVVIPTTIIVNDEEVIIEKIDKGAYQGKGLISVKFPDGLKRIEDYAFAGNQLIGAIIPTSVEHIGDYAFGFNEVTLNNKSKATIRNINIEKDEYINKLDKYGNIIDDSKVKISIINNKVNLLNYIFITEFKNFTISDDAEIIEGEEEIEEEEEEELIVEPVVPYGYVLATDSDFSGSSNGSFRYIGSHTHVVIPHVIKGVPVTSYASMFSMKPIRGVASNNPNITNMASMFFLQRGNLLDLSYLETSGVTNMGSMFQMSEAKTLNLSSFDTSNVTNMGAMLYDTHATTINVSSFRTANVTSMEQMFGESSVTTLDLSSFDTSKVNSVSGIFAGSNIRTVYARTGRDIDKFNSSSNKPSGLRITVR